LDTRDAVLSSNFSHITKLLTSLPMLLEGPAGTARTHIVAMDAKKIRRGPSGIGLALTCALVTDRVLILAMSASHLLGAPLEAQQVFRSR
jgi:hypothetical protein